MSGPIIDRIDLHLEVPQVEHEKLSDDSRFGEPSEKIRERVIKAREIQKQRFIAKNKNIITNSEMGVRELKTFASLTEAAKQTILQAAKHLDLSARAYHRVIKIGRTIADLEGDNNVNEGYILEALQYRPKVS